jgi:hypothetical protein
VSGGCSGPYWQQHVEPQAWPALLHQAGYTTFYAGKYLNKVSVRTCLLLIFYLVQLIFQLSNEPQRT